MNELEDLKCQVCQVGAPQLSDVEITKLLRLVSKWELISENNVKKLIRKFKFNNFKETLAFVNKVGAVAEEQGHHPDMFVEYNRITIWWWTHKIKGLHQNDFVMAAKVNKLLD